MAGRATIAAVATPWGRSAVGLVRVSGPHTGDLLQAVTGAPLPAPRRAVLRTLVDRDGPFDQGLVTWMPGPGSYTGEDAAEITCHGNPLLLERLLAACVACGARPATPGEFTRRAFLNGRLDLTRAEAVLQAVEARSPEGLRVAGQGLQGEIAAFGEALRGRIVAAAAELQARLDFPEELEAEPAWEERLLGEVEAVRREASRVAGTWQVGHRGVHGARVALVGPVNAGKSSLFNALLGRRRALVSDTPGTTRDVVEARTLVGGLEVTLLDTAGDNDAPGALESEGLALRDALLEDVDLVVVVLPAHALGQPAVAGVLRRTAGRPRLLVGNHADRPGAAFTAGQAALLPACALDGTGVEALREAITGALRGEEPAGTRLVIASLRQRDLLQATARLLAAAGEALAGDAGPVVALEELLEAGRVLGGLEGHGVREEVLDALFARFCIGK